MTKAWIKEVAVKLDKMKLNAIQKGFPGGSVVKNPPANAGEAVWSLAGEHPLEEEMATYSSILAWEIPWTVEPGGLYSPRGYKEQNTTYWLNTTTNEVTGGWRIGEQNPLGLSRTERVPGRQAFQF